MLCQRVFFGLAVQGCKVSSFANAIRFCFIPRIITAGIPQPIAVVVAAPEPSLLSIDSVAFAVVTDAGLFCAAGSATAAAAVIAAGLAAAVRGATLAFAARAAFGAVCVGVRVFAYAGGVT